MIKNIKKLLNLKLKSKIYNYLIKISLWKNYIVRLIFFYKKMPGGARDAKTSAALVSLKIKA